MFDLSCFKSQVYGFGLFKAVSCLRKGNRKQLFDRACRDLKLLSFRVATKRDLRHRVDWNIKEIRAICTGMGSGEGIYFIEIGTRLWVETAGNSLKFQLRQGYY